jgi:hypothetical protein
MILRYCDSKLGAGDSGCWCCDSECASSDSGVSKSVTGQTAFTHMRRRSAGAGEAAPRVRHLAESWIRDGNGASGVPREPDGAQAAEGRTLRPGRAAGGDRGVDARTEAGSRRGCRSGRMWHRACGQPLSTPLAALPFSARRSDHFACEDEPSCELAARPVVFASPSGNLVTPNPRQPSGKDIRLPLRAERQRVSMGCAANGVCTTRCVFSPHYSM